jgi:cephalosporin hydroxylase
MSLWQDFMTNDGKYIHKWVHYFPIYERHLAWYRNRSLTFLEVGVQRGGSLQMWQRYFGPLAKIVGIDINPACKEHEGPGIAVRIGDQSDPAFLQSVIDEFGVPDVVLDDGSHQMHHILATFKYLYPQLPKNAIYAVEDLHTAYWPEFGGGVNEPASFINICKGYIDQLNADHSRGALAPDVITRETLGISFYDSVVIFEKGDVWRKEAPATGKKKSLLGFRS